MNLEFCSDLLLVKNETVNGIIGKTHGVRSANKPPINPSINRFKYELEAQLEIDGSPHGNNGCGIEFFKYPFATANDLSLIVSA